MGTRKTCSGLLPTVTPMAGIVMDRTTEVTKPCTFRDTLVGLISVTAIIDQGEGHQVATHKSSLEAERLSLRTTTVLDASGYVVSTLFTVRVTAVLPTGKDAARVP